MLALNLLGSPHITLDGNPVTGFISSKALALLCFLALENDRQHTRDSVACLLWGEVSEESARRSLSQALHNLHKLVPGHLIVTRQTVTFDKSQPYELDVTAFDILLQQTEASASQLETAIAIYQGDFLEGIFITDAPTFEEWLMQERGHYRLLLLAALERLVDHRTRQGEWEAAKNLARRALSIEPWREALHRQLMLLLARQGEYNDALAQYETCRQVLKQELGIAPDAKTQALQTRIQKLRTTRRHNLPSTPSTLVGRHAQLQILAAWLHDPHCRLITLLGPGGIGKTRLSIELAYLSLDKFLDGVWFVPLSAIRRPEYLITAVADTLETNISNSNPQQKLLQQLADRELLLLLDGFERLAGAANFVTELLQAAPQVKVIVTSRQRLDLREEWAFPLPGLATPPEDDKSDLPLEKYEAIEHFITSARQRHDFVINDQGTMVAHLCRLLGGLPLGIELAAALLPTVSCAQIVAEVERSLDVLTTSQRDVPERHRSLRAVFEQSWLLLTDDERTIFPRLSIFRGGFTLDAARQVAGAEFHDLKGLISKSLLSVSIPDESTAARYTIHEALRQYAEERLAALPSRQQQVQAAYVTYYAGFTQQQEACWVKEERQAFFTAMTTELDNIRLAWQWAIERLDIDSLGCMMESLHLLHRARCWYQDGITLFASALNGLGEASQPDQGLVRGRLLAYRAPFEAYLGRIDTAKLLAKEAIALLRPQGVSKHLVVALNMLGNIQFESGDYGSARETQLENLAIARTLNNRQQIAGLILNLSGIYICMGDYAAAKLLLEESLTICYEDEYRFGFAITSGRLGDLAYATENWRDALHYYEQSFEISQSSEQTRYSVVLLTHWSKTHLRLGEFEQALARSETALKLARQTEDFPIQIEATALAGVAQHYLGNQRTARSCLREGLEIARKIQDTPPIYTLLILAALLQFDDGQQAAAVDLLTLVTHASELEQYDRDYAAALLAERGAALRENTPHNEQRTLTEIVKGLLDEMNATD